MKNLADKPFALVGFNVVSSHDPLKLKQVMEKEQITWRSFINSDAAAEQWNNPGTPMYYVIDPQGVIRYKWFGYPGAKALDRALEELIQEVDRK